MTIHSFRTSALAVLAMLPLAFAATGASPALARDNGSSGGGRSMSDILRDGYHCIAQNPRNGMIWCVRGHDEGGYLCTPEGWCTPVPPSPTPPWRITVRPGTLLHPPGQMAPLRR